MKLSIIITVHNLEDYIALCLDSVANIRMPSTDYEIIVIDDGSTDQSWEILSKCINKFSNMKIYSQENQGVGSARNLGISKAGGNYLWFVDGDDLVISDNVAEAIDFATMTEADVILFDYLPINEKGNFENWISFKSKFGDLTFLSGPEYYLLNLRHSYLWVHFFKRSLFVENGLLFHSNIKMQDGEFLPKILNKTKKVAYFKEKLIKYRYRPNSAVNNQDEAVRAHFYYSIVTVKLRLKEYMETLNPDSIMYQALVLKHIQLNQMLFTNLINNNYSEATNQTFVSLLKQHKLLPLKKITGFTFLMNLKFNIFRIILNLNPFLGRKIYQKVFN